MRSSLSGDRPPLSVTDASHKILGVPNDENELNRWPGEDFASPDHKRGLHASLFGLPKSRTKVQNVKDAEEDEDVKRLAEVVRADETETRRAALDARAPATAAEEMMAPLTSDSAVSVSAPEVAPGVVPAAVPKGVHRARAAFFNDTTEATMADEPMPVAQAQSAKGGAEEGTQAAASPQRSKEQAALAKRRKAEAAEAETIAAQRRDEEVAAMIAAQVVRDAQAVALAAQEEVVEEAAADAIQQADVATATEARLKFQRIEQEARAAAALRATQKGGGGGPSPTNATKTPLAAPPFYFGKPTNAPTDKASDPSDQAKAAPFRPAPIRRRSPRTFGQASAEGPASPSSPDDTRVRAAENAREEAPLARESEGSRAAEAERRAAAAEGQAEAVAAAARDLLAGLEAEKAAAEAATRARDRKRALRQLSGRLLHSREAGAWQAWARAVRSINAAEKASAVQSAQLLRVAARIVGSRLARALQQWREASRLFVFEAVLAEERAAAAAAARAKDAAKAVASETHAAALEAIEAAKTAEVAAARKAYEDALAAAAEERALHSTALASVEAARAADLAAATHLEEATAEAAAAALEKEGAVAAAAAAAAKARSEQQSRAAAESAAAGLQRWFRLAALLPVLLLLWTWPAPPVDPSLDSAFSAASVDHAFAEEAEEAAARVLGKMQAAHAGWDVPFRHPLFGSVAVVLGCSGGGLEAASVLAGVGMRVVCAGPSSELEAAKAAVANTHPAAPFGVEALAVDLEAAGSVRAFAKALNRKFPAPRRGVGPGRWLARPGFRIAALVNNAFASGHGNGLLATVLLLPRLQGGADGFSSRVIAVALCPSSGVTHGEKRCGTERACVIPIQQCPFSLAGESQAGLFAGALARRLSGPVTAAATQ